MHLKRLGVGALIVPEPVPCHAVWRIRCSLSTSVPRLSAATPVVALRPEVKRDDIVFRRCSLQVYARESVRYILCSELAGEKKRASISGRCSFSSSIDFFFHGFVLVSLLQVHTYIQHCENENIEGFLDSFFLHIFSYRRVA